LKKCMVFVAPLKLEKTLPKIQTSISNLSNL